MATNVCIALRGSDASLADDGYRITGIASPCASNGQVNNVLQAAKWNASVYWVGWTPPLLLGFVPIMFEDGSKVKLVVAQH